MPEVSYAEFARQFGSAHISEFVDSFFQGSQAECARALNVSRQTLNQWVNSDDPIYEVEVVYCEFESGHVTHDYIVKKQIKRIGVIGSEFYGGSGYVYAISNGSITKIGASKNPKERIKAVASSIGFDEYESFISNRTAAYKKSEKLVHNEFSDKKRDNTIYVREVFECSLEEAKEAIERLLIETPTGPRPTGSSMFKAIRNL